MFREVLFITALVQMLPANGNICYNSICIPQNYSKSVKPSSLVKVSMNFGAIQFLEIDDSKSIIELYLYMEYRWQEPRLIVSSKSPEYMPLAKEFLDLLWTPDFYFFGQQKIEIRYHITGGVSTESLWLRKNNFVSLDLGLRPFVACKMRFETYPFDSHDCYLTIGSWSHTEETLQIETE